ncbi:hypothetical protein IWQ60_009096 [Tieghemiomyces parasiticus]|uniref:Alginate lyase domain-containing protein n=1 Tax=Tieghemiomyces parasiticus TaxID=78921 RepID=A0A9W7ZYY3_9FUNG|nr:hypothetical protein IWQ60_009096 [Tieghemiomyces parasiticus]
MSTQKTNFYTVINRKAYWPAIDRNDYVSYAVYYSPDCTLPASRAVQTICLNIPRLAFIVYLLDDPIYTARDFFLLNKFFVDPTTRMNSHLNFGRIIPEPRVTSGGSEGLVELNCFASFVQYPPLFPTLAVDQRTPYQGMVTWFRDFRTWFYTSPIGQGEIGTPNNHGSNATLQLTAYSLLLDDAVGAKSVLIRFMAGAYQHQINATGAQPLELERTNSFTYSAENLGILYTMATLGGQVTGVNM